MVEYKERQKEALESLFKTDTALKHIDEFEWKRKHGFDANKYYNYDCLEDDEVNELTGFEKDAFFSKLNNWWFYIEHFRNPEYNLGIDTYNIETIVHCADGCCMYGKDYNPLSFSIHVDNRKDVGVCYVSGSLESIDDDFYEWVIDETTIERAIEIISEQIKEFETLKSSDERFNADEWRSRCIEKYGARIN